MKEKVCVTVSILAVIFILGTVGALSCSTISCTQAAIQIIAGALVLAGHRYVTWIEDKRRRLSDD